jgi:hypothetical protein
VCLPPGPNLEQDYFELKKELDLKIGKDNYLLNTRKVQTTWESNVYMILSWNYSVAKDKFTF